MDTCTVFRGYTSFEDPRTRCCGEDLLRADRIFLNAGGHAVVSDIPGLCDIEFLTYVV
nr:hypothetical protein [Mycobacterium leprae]